MIPHCGCFSTFLSISGALGNVTLHITHCLVNQWANLHPIRKSVCVRDIHMHSSVCICVVFFRGLRWSYQHWNVLDLNFNSNKSVISVHFSHSNQSKEHQMFTNLHTYIFVSQLAECSLPQGFWCPPLPLGLHTPFSGDLFLSPVKYRNDTTQIYA